MAVDQTGYAVWDHGVDNTFEALIILSFPLVIWVDAAPLESTAVLHQVAPGRRGTGWNVRTYPTFSAAGTAPPIRSPERFFSPVRFFSRSSTRTSSRFLLLSPSLHSSPYSFCRCIRCLSYLFTPRGARKPPRPAAFSYPASLRGEHPRTSSSLLLGLSPLPVSPRRRSQH